MQMLEYINDFDVDAYDENDTPVCVCADYIGTTHVTFCWACHDYTDNIEIAKMEAAERKPAAIAYERTNAIAEVA